jgi:hypothetical protein
MKTQSPTELIEQLDPDAILRELQELDARERALRILLRVARAREKARARAASRRTP